MKPLSAPHRLDASTAAVCVKGQLVSQLTYRAGNTRVQSWVSVSFGQFDVTYLNAGCKVFCNYYTTMLSVSIIEFKGKSWIEGSPGTGLRKGTK